MEFFNPNIAAAASMDVQRDFQFMSNNNNNHRSPPPSHRSFPNSSFNSPPHDPLVPPIWYSFDRFGSPINDSSAVKFHQILLQNQRGNTSSPSSRGSLSPLPLISIENLETPPSRSPPVKYATPVKVEEDVLVMDAILVKSPPGGSGGNRSKSVLDSRSPQSRSSYGGNNKSELCHSWEMTKTCPYGSKCQFAHGKEDVRPNRQNSTKSKSDITFNTTGSSPYGTKWYPKLPNVVAKEQEKGKAVSLPARGAGIDQDLQTVVWSPMDDSIPVYKMPSSAAEPHQLADKEQLEAHIKSILYGPPQLKRRLPVFTEIYSED